MGNWTFDGPNALTGYTVGIDVGQLSPAVIRQVSALHPNFKRDLPRRLEQQALTFVVGGAPMTQSPAPEINGVVFDSLMPDGRTKAALSIGPNALFYSAAEYTRWVEFWPVAERLLSAAARIVMTEAPAKGFILMANNRFQWSDSATSPDLNSLVCAGTPYLPPRILECKGPCHNFYGYTVTQTSPAGDRTDNILFSVMNLPEGQIVADVNFNLRLALQQPVDSFDTLLGNEIGGPRSYLEEALWNLHQLNKDLFRATIRSEIGDKMPGLSS